VLLVGLGFGAGVLVGVISEEPELLVGHLRGESETVSLASLQLESETDRGDAQWVASGRRLEEVDSASRTQSARRLSLQRETGESGAATLPRVAAAIQPNARTGVFEAAGASASKRGVDDSSQWAIQVGAFAEKAAARRLAESLEAKHYPVELIASKGATKRWRVRVQPIRGESKARGIVNQLKRDERLPTWMIPLEAPSGQ
jgi:cell division septation protein DedD